MPKYLIERTYDVGEEGLPSLARRSKQITVDQFPEITWLHSHVVMDKDGTLKSFCVYIAPSEEIVRRHAELLGAHVVDRIFEIGGDVTPDDFPLSA